MKARLVRAMCGWMLIPLSDDSYQALNMLYGTEYKSLKPSEKGFSKQKSLTGAISELKRVSAQMNIKLSLCGEKLRPTIRFWLPKAQPKPTESSVDLKWACWSTDECVWETYAPNVLHQIKESFTGNAAPITVYTAPRKEIRYGSVTVSKGCASGYFRCEWDDVECLAEVLQTTCDESFKETIPFSHGEPGVDRYFDIKSRRFSKLMQQISQEEDLTVSQSNKKWEMIEQCFCN